MNEFKPKNVRLSDHAAKNVKSIASEAADFIADSGGSPKEQLEAARSASGQKLQYTSHFGSRQQERAFKKMQKAMEKKNG